MKSCPMCSKTFKSQGELTVHLVRHTKEKPHKCQACSAAFGRSIGLKAHTRAVHEGVKKVNKNPKERSMECPICGYKCSDRHRLKAHSLKHSAEMPFSCNKPSCGFKTKYEKSLTIHVRVVHSLERPYPCTAEGCNFKAKRRRALQSHIINIHSTEKPFVCNISGCNFACKAKKRLNSHIYNVHNDEKPFKCSICDFCTKYKSRLRQHEDGHKNILRFHCQVPKCCFATTDNQYLQLHVGRKHNKKDFVCKVLGCKFRCGTLPILKYHVRLYHERPIFKCPGDSCNYSTRSLKNLRLHVTRKHGHLDSPGWLLNAVESDSNKVGEKDDVQSLFCPLSACDYQTEFQHRYDHHMQAHDGGKRRHICRICSFRFRSPAELGRHIQSHTGEKPYSCSYCKYTTSSSGELRKHAGKRHFICVAATGEENRHVRKCCTCGMTTSSYTEFVVHSMTHLKAVVVLGRLNLHVM